MGEGAPVQGIDNLLDRMERDEFDMVAVGRAAPCFRTGVGGEGPGGPVRGLVVRGRWCADGAGLTAVAWQRR